MTSDPGASAAFDSFHQLQLSPPVLAALKEVGYEIPTPIQAQIIPHMLAGRDVLGQAQTGTGKTAAFALPLLCRVNVKNKFPQALVLVPTRELAIQVAEAFQRYASKIRGFHVLPIYGGQDYGSQLRQLKRGAQVIVGTPGRVMDHMRRGTLKLEGLSCLVLDEGDEMLRMGFIDDVKWVLEQTPPQRQIALFSATIPPAIRKIAKSHLNDAVEVTIKVKTTAAETIRQRVWIVRGVNKLDALTRILETETFHGVLIFVRTKNATVELAEKLTARGHATAAINGDMAQKTREQTIDRLKKGKLDILVATDVAARGLDVERLSHVINYDIPYDVEAYVHRIGRTGRAGRDGDAILFVAPREKRLLSAIEKSTRNKIQEMELPSTEAINKRRIAQYKARIDDTVASEDLRFFKDLLVEYTNDNEIPILDIAAALAFMSQGSGPFLLKPGNSKQESGSPARDPVQRDRKKRKPTGVDQPRPIKSREAEEGMVRYRIEVGRDHKVKPGNIVGAIANEAGLDAEFIGRVNIFSTHSTVDLPKGMPKDVFHDLEKARVVGRPLKISRLTGEKPKNKGKPKKSKEGKAHKSVPKQQKIEYETPD